MRICLINNWQNNSINQLLENLINEVHRIWKDFTVNNIKKTGLGRVPQFFSVDLNNMATDNILDIHKYLMEKNISNVWVS